jgi:hypothetical protein
MLTKIGGWWLDWVIVVIFISGIRPILIGLLGGDQMGAVIISGIIRVIGVGIDRTGRVIVLRVGMSLPWGHKICFKNLGLRNRKD